MKIITIIPARGGSRGILKKNIRIVGGLPLIVHSIRHSISAKMVDRTIVSTDDDEISKISKNFQDLGSWPSDFDENLSEHEIWPRGITCFRSRGPQ